MSSDDLDDARCMTLYYRERFPARTIWRMGAREWDSEDVPTTACRREWGIEERSGAYFARYRMCATAEDLSKMVMERGVGKVNMGAVYNHNVSAHATARDFAPLGREFVVDIDLDDYTYSGRASGADLEGCDRAWPLMAMNITIVATMMREAFGVSQMQVVYSGRRGVHLHVFDRRAFEWDDKVRSAIVSFFQRERANAPRHVEVSASESVSAHTWFDLVTNPDFTGVVEELEQFFRAWVIRPYEAGGLGLLDEDFQRREFMARVGQGTLRRLESTIGTGTADGVYERIKQDCVRNGCIPHLHSAIWELAGPRLDAGVSIHRNHMLKIPFSVHPKTGRVCVPVFGKLFRFSPARDAPNIAAIARGDESALKSLHDAEQAFARFLNSLHVDAARGEKRARANGSLDDVHDW